MQEKIQQLIYIALRLKILLFTFHFVQTCEPYLSKTKTLDDCHNDNRTLETGP